MSKMLEVLPSARELDTWRFGYAELDIEEEGDFDYTSDRPRPEPCFKGAELDAFVRAVATENKRKEQEPITGTQKRARTIGESSADTNPHLAGAAKAPRCTMVVGSTAMGPRSPQRWSLSNRRSVLMSLARSVLLLTCAGLATGGECGRTE